jgi:hypothetical protein
MQNGEPGQRAGMDDLGRLQADLRRLPRHQWDRYLWEFCSRFVQRRAAFAESGASSGDGRGDTGDGAGA